MNVFILVTTRTRALRELGGGAAKEEEEEAGARPENRTDRVTR
jgi:hypothetical protein